MDESFYHIWGLDLPCLFLLLRRAQGFLGSLSQDRYLVYYDRVWGYLWLYSDVQDISFNRPHPISDDRLAGDLALRRNLPYVLYGDGRRGLYNFNGKLSKSPKR